jgi:hypothetical protein
MRWLAIFNPSEDGMGDGSPFVVAESSDLDFLTDSTPGWGQTIIDKEAASLDPQFSEAVEAWDSCDDRQHSAWEAFFYYSAEAVEEAEEVMRLSGWRDGLIDGGADSR